MYICVCNAVKEQEVRDLARQFPGDSVEQLYARLGIEVDCGSCLSFADGVVDAARAGSGQTVVFDPSTLKNPPRPEALQTV